MASSLDADPTLAMGPLPPIVGKLFANRYEIQALLGRGGMGSVYRAHDREVDEVVALKTLDVAPDDLEAVDRFRSEVRLARRVTHRNAARTYDLGEHGQLRYLTMEYVDGHSLRSYMHRRLGVRACIDIARQIAAGLEAAHAAGIIHRDLKPSNVMIEQGGRVVITDFGVARMAGERAKQQTKDVIERGAKARVSGLVGTPAYMAPEQVEGKPLDARVDLYALGLILVELLTGKLPFTGDNALALAMARLEVELPKLDASGQIPAPLLPVLERALQRDREARFADAASLGLALALAYEQLDLDEASDADSGEAWVSAAQPLPTQTTTTDRTGLRLPTSTTMQSRALAKAIAVLPFRYRGPAESDYVAEALLDELTDLLSMTRGLKVSSSGATAKLVNAGERDPRAVGATLGVDVVVDGTIQLAGDRLRISARLLEVESGFQIWSERFDGTLADVFDLQDKLGKRIAEALRLELQILEHRELADIDALESYLRARQAKVRWRLRGSTGAIAHYNAVLARAPAFKPAIAGLAIAVMRAWFMPEADEGTIVDWPKLAKASVERAMAEAPEFAESRIAAASWAVQGGFYREAAEHLREALRIAPTCALAHEYLGRLQLEAAHPERGVAHAELALELDPGLYWCHADLGRHYALRGDYDGFDARMRKLGDRSDRYRAGMMLLQIRVAAWRRDIDRVRAVHEQLMHEQEEGVRTMQMYAPPLLAPYEPEAVAAQQQMILASTSGNGRLVTMLRQLFAEQTAFHRDDARALEHLQAAAELALVDLDWLDHCPLFVDLRADPRFAALRSKVHARSEQIWVAG